MKYLVETPGNFMLVDALGRQEIPAWRPAVVTVTAFITNQLGTKLTKLEDLDESASDEGLAMARSDAELAAAIADLPRVKSPEKSAKAPAKTTKE